MSNGSYSRARRAERQRELSLRRFAREFEFGFLQPPAGEPSDCDNPDAHALYVAVAEAAFMDAFERDVVLDDWTGHNVPGFGMLVTHSLPCRCELTVCLA